MIWQPVIVAIVALDAVSMMVLLHAAYASVMVLLHWQAGSPDPRQLNLEALVDASAYAGRFTLFLQVIASTLLIVAIAHVLPVFIPGAMCGTGVMQATGGLGWRAIGLRIVALLFLWVWYSVDAINRKDPASPLILTASRLVLVAVPLLALATWSTLQSVYGLNLDDPVNCCAVIYDQVGASGTSSGLLMFLGDGLLTYTTVFMAFILAVFSVWIIFRPMPLKGHRYPVLLFFSLAWTILATTALIRVFAAYHYGVLYHYCPWCLFLPEHSMVGYPLFGALFGILAATVAMAIIAKTATGSGIDDRIVGRRMQMEAWVTLAGLAVYVCLGIGPAFWWRLSYGVWMH